MTASLRLSGVDPTILADIRRASQSAHVDFDFLLATARQESGFDPNAEASGTRATGLYQFIDSTWLRAVKQWGAKYGLGAEAEAITLTQGGGAAVADAATRQHILDLRRDPALSASLAAELAHDNKAAIERGLGRPASATDLYLAHFLGADGASRFVKEIEADGSASAADLLPQAAAANRSVFYDQAGHAKTVAEIYQSFARRIEGQAETASQATGTDRATGAELVAFGAASPAGIDSPTRSATLDMLALAALDLIGRAGRRRNEADLFRPAPKTGTDTSA